MKVYRSDANSSVLMRFLVATFLSVGFCGIALSDEIEGTWRLVSRKLPDGTIQTPPTVMGLFNLLKGVRNLNVFWHTPDGKPASYSLVSTYTLTDREYTETLQFSMLNDPSGGQPAVYNLSGGTKSVPLTRKEGRVSYKLPFDLPSLVIEGDKLTATAEGAFIDYWEKVK